MKLSSKKKSVAKKMNPQKDHNWRAKENMPHESEVEKYDRKSLKSWPKHKK